MQWLKEWIWKGLITEGREREAAFAVAFSCVCMCVCVCVCVLSFSAFAMENINISLLYDSNDSPAFHSFPIYSAYTFSLLLSPFHFGSSPCGRKEHDGRRW